MENGENENINTDFSELLKDFNNKWVILSEDNSIVLASAEKLEDIADRLSDGILFKVPDPNSYLAPHSLTL